MKALGLLLALVATPASALSCLPRTPVQAFEEAAASEARYSVVKGKLSFRAAAMPEHYDVEAEDKVVTGFFRGEGLNLDGFTTPMAVPVALEVACSGPWCGTLVKGQEYLLFLEKRADGYALEVSACPMFAFPNPDADTLEAMTACINGACPN